MATEVVMPQMGESITEGTITKWLKQVGDKVERDEMIFEISTDKVDAEIPSPTAGILLQILHEAGETLEVGKVVAVVGDASEAGRTAAPAASNGSSANGNVAKTTAATTQTAQTESAGLEAEKESAEAMDAETPGATAQPEAVAPPALAETPQTETLSQELQTTSSAPASTEGATEIVMPQMGESITEGTITKWLKKVGDKVERDEMIFEISTDKVDAEIPSPTAGTLLEIRGQEGETLEVGTIVALVGAEGAAPAASRQPPETNNQAAQTSNAQSAIRNPQSGEGGHPEQAETAGRSYDYQRPEAVEESKQTLAAPAAQTKQNGGNGNVSVEELRRTKSSPLVRKIASEHSIDISQISGSGVSGRVTKDDIINFIASGKALTPQQAMATAKSGADLPPVSQMQVQPQQQFAEASAQPQLTMPVAQTPTQVPVSAVGDRVEQMSVMRKKIAQHMTLSKQTSAHVTSVYEIDMTNITKFRERNKNDFQARYGTKLTYMPFIFQAVSTALRKFPIVNSQVSGEQIIYKGDINLGMAVALDWGLIVPVIKRADTLSLAGLAITANDLAERARTKKLMPDEVSGGTFTITNPGVFGGLFGTPIINQPQVAILCVGTIEKRAKVITSPEGDDYIAIRSMAYFALTFDHRIVDGADAERFLSFLKQTLETGQYAV
ncbi:MAG: 2-oxoglutarate dehydrogenase, E2 component, dihydrolipoamide succinyltransferase [Pyrinomonadaceae bacterium]